MNNQKCHSCGLPSWACSRGYTTRITTKAKNCYQRDRTATIWCCSRLCAIISHAIAEMGAASHKWPITLREYVNKYASSLDIQEVRLERTDMAPQPTDSKKPKMTKNELMDLDPTQRETVRKRPFKRKKWTSEAERLRAYRARKRETAVVPTATLTFADESCADARLIQ